MSELPSTRPDATELHWADGGTPNTTTMPNEGKKDDGFVLEDTPPAAEENWWRKRTGELAAYFAGAVPRVFTTLSEGITATAAGDVFRILPNVTNINTRLAEQYNKEGEGGAVAVVAVRTDGERIYYAQGDHLIAASPEDSDDVDWNVQPTVGVNILDLWADGFKVYVLLPYGANLEAILINPATGTITGSAHIASPSCTLIRANGSHMVIGQGNSLLVYNNLSAVPAYLGAYDHTAAVRAAALTNSKALTSASETELAIIGGSRGTDTFDVRAVKMSDRAALWSVQLPTTAAPTINAIVSDGERCYVAFDAGTISGNWACVACLSELTGDFLWAAPNGNFNADLLAVDDKLLYVSSDAGNLHVYDKRTGETIGLVSGDIFVGDCDGVSIVGHDGANNVLRHHSGVASQTFVRVEGDDPNRRPFHNLAVPA